MQTLCANLKQLLLVAFLEKDTTDIEKQQTTGNFLWKIAQALKKP